MGKDSSAIVGELITLFKQELQHCKLKTEETLCILTDPRSNSDYAAAFFGAAKELGSNVFQITVPFFTKKAKHVARAYSEDIIPPGGPLEAMKAADLVIDLSTVDWLYTNVHNEVLRAGTRTLMVGEPEDVLRRLLPHPDVKARCLAGVEVLSKGRKIRITTKAGTDLTFDKTGRKGMAQYGASDVPGRWDHWPSGQVACAPVEGTAEGRLVINVGDIILRLQRYVSEKVVCTFENGRIVKIEGGIDAFLLEEYMKTWQDEKAYIPSHIGWGAEHRAIWYQLAAKEPGGLMDAESFYGDVLFGMGANHFIGLGGMNVTSAHIDFCLRECNMWVDDLQVLAEGTIVPEELK